MSVNIDNLNTVPSMAQKTKTVEGRLMETLRCLARTEGNLYLFTTLKSFGLSTNDITHFVSKQSIHKRVKTKIDDKVRKAAMHSKIVDASAYAKRLRQEKNTWRQRILKKYQNCRSKGKRIVDDLLSKYRDLRRQEYIDADKKIKLYRDKNEANKSLKQVPECTSEFLDGVNIFSLDHEIRLASLPVARDLR